MYKISRVSKFSAPFVVTNLYDTAFGPRPDRGLRLLQYFTHAVINRIQIVALCIYALTRRKQS